MAQHYSDSRRESEPTALPDIEVFWIGHSELKDYADCGVVYAGYYWWSCFPGCLPDGDPMGPFGTEAEALADAREGSE
jgi:hypothetical protein